jgi:MarR family transcriptional regulator for hemolysin
MEMEQPIGLVVTRTAKALSRAFDEALAEGGGSLPGWLVLASLKGAAHASQRQLAGDVGIEGATLTHHLGRMEAAGLVARERDPQDKRAQLVALTAAGDAEFFAQLAVVRGFDERLRAGLSDAEVATLRDLLARLLRNAIGSDAEATSPPPHLRSRRARTPKEQP